ncbi:MAG: hypothetical protein ABSB19_11485, partial [Methylomonas sp.]
VTDTFANLEAAQSLDPSLLTGATDGYTLTDAAGANFANLSVTDANLLLGASDYASNNYSYTLSDNVAALESTPGSAAIAGAQAYNVTDTFANLEAASTLNPSLLPGATDGYTLTDAAGANFADLSVADAALLLGASDYASNSYSYTLNDSVAALLGAPTDLAGAAGVTVNNEGGAVDITALNSLINAGYTAAIDTSGINALSGSLTTSAADADNLLVNLNADNGSSLSSLENGGGATLNISDEVSSLLQYQPLISALESGALTETLNETGVTGNDGTTGAITSSGGANVDLALQTLSSVFTVDNAGSLTNIDISAITGVTSGESLSISYDSASQTETIAFGAGAQAHTIELLGVTTEIQQSAINV